MHHHSYRRKLSLSQTTIPLALLITWLCHVLPQWNNWESWLGWGCAVGITHLVIESNNLLRYLQWGTRLLGAFTLILLTAVYPSYHINWEWGITISLLFFIVLLYSCYRQNCAPGKLYLAFLTLGLISFLFPPLLTLALFAWFMMATLMRCMSWRNFMGSIFGLITPYWIYTAIAIWQQRINTLTNFFTPYIQIHFNYNNIWTLQQRASLVLIAILLIFSYIHFFRTTLKDKIYVRRYHFTSIALEILLFLLLLAYPTYYNYLIGFLVINLMPLTIRYFTLAQGRWFDVWFKGWLIALVLLLLFNNPIFQPYFS